MDVCLKVIPLNNGASEQEIEREAKMLSELNNIHVIRYYESFIELGNYYIVMEYAKEGSLDETIAVCYILVYIVIILLMYLLEA